MKKKTVIFAVSFAVALAALSVFAVRTIRLKRLAEELSYKPEESVSALSQIRGVGLSEEELKSASDIDIDSEIAPIGQKNPADMIAQRSEAKIVKAEKTQCTVIISAPDYFAILKEFAKGRELNADNLSQTTQEMREYMISALESGSFPVRSEELTLEMQDGKPVLDTRYYNAIYGGILDAFSELFEQLTRQGE